MGTVTIDDLQFENTKWNDTIFDKCKVRLYGLKIIDETAFSEPIRSNNAYEILSNDENKVLIHNLVPKLRTSDNKPGLYDENTGDFYTNDGTGEFGYIIRES